MNTILADEEFVMVGPSAVRALDGKVLDAMMLQYLHFWLRISKNYHDGHVWVYNTYEAWSDKLGISPDQAKRAMMRLESWGEDGDRLVISCQNHNNRFNHTKWYRVNYECSFFHPIDLAESPDHDWAISPDRLVGIAQSKTESTKTERTYRENLKDNPLLSSLPLSESRDVILSDNLEDLGPRDTDQGSGLSHSVDTITLTSDPVSITPPPSPPVSIIEKDDTPSDARVVFEAWVQIMDKPRAKLTSERRTKINARLRSGELGVADLIDAIRGAKADPWMMGENNRNTVYDDLVTILKNDESANRHASNFRKGTRGGSKPSMKPLGQMAQIDAYAAQLKAEAAHG